jgi:hypothetical protein
LPSKFKKDKIRIEVKKLSKIIAVVIFILGSASVANAVFPGTTEQLKNIVEEQFFTKPPEESLQTTSESIDQVLGTLTENGEDGGESAGEVIDQLKKVPKKIISEEIINEVTTEVNKVVIEKVSETKEIPAQEVDKVKKEIKKQIYQQFCAELEEDE